jgi:DNA-binding winged helix-turn-helix (wHTH) protein
LSRLLFDNRFVSVVLREEIRKRLWPDDTVLEFDHGINAAVKRLRDVLLRIGGKTPLYRNPCAAIAPVGACAQANPIER